MKSSIPTDLECEHEWRNATCMKCGAVSHAGYTVFDTPQKVGSWEERETLEVPSHHIRSYSYDKYDELSVVIDLPPFLKDLLSLERERLEVEIGGRCWEHEKKAREDERERIVEMAEGMMKNKGFSDELDEKGEEIYGGAYNMALSTLIVKIREMK